MNMDRSKAKLVLPCLVLAVMTYMLLQSSQNVVDQDDIKHTLEEVSESVHENKRSDSIAPQRASSSFEVCEPGVRYRHAKKVCQSNHWTHEDYVIGQEENKPFRGNIFVDDRHKVLFCVNSKVASTSLKYYFCKINNVPPNQEKHQLLNTTGMRLLPDLSKEETENVMKNYFKFTVVRHPFDRIRSGWMDKVGCTKCHRGSSHVRKTVMEYMDSKEPTTSHNDTNVDFDHFIQFVSKDYHKGFMDQHWFTYADNCGICDIPYTHIFRSETIGTDIQVLYDHLQTVRPDYDVPHLVSHNVIRYEDILQKMFKIRNLYKDFEPDVINRLIDLYRKDLEVYGYHWDGRNGSLCSVPKGDDISSGTCC